MSLRKMLGFGNVAEHPGLGDLLIALLRNVIGQAPLRVTGAAALVVLSGALETMRLALLVPIIDTLDQRPGSTAWSAGLASILARLGVDRPFARLSLLMGAFVLATVARALMAYGRDVQLVRLQSDLVNAERSRVLQMIGRAGWQRVAMLDHARITNIVSVEAQRLGTSTQLLVDAATGLVLLVFQTGVAVALAPRLALATLLIILVGGALTLAQQGRSVELGRRFSRANQMLLASTARLLSGLKAAIAQGAERSFIAEFEVAQQSVREQQLAFAVSRGRRNLWIAVAGAATAALVVLIGSGGFGVPLAVLLTTMFVFYRMSVPAARVVAAVQNLAFALPGYQSMRMLDRELAIGTIPDADVPPQPPGAIALHRASYRHPGGGGLEAVDLDLAPGSFTGIMGPSGHGKTTLVDLLAGLLTPQSGALVIGGEAIVTEAQRRAWRGQIAYATQDGFLFNDTLRRNLTWGADGACEDALRQAIALAGADPLVERLGGLHAVLGERGTLISGGERQRIAIARALLRRPRLLLLDEATHAIDAAGEAALLDRLAGLCPRPTVLMISHRRESMQHCDRILELRDGCLLA